VAVDGVDGHWHAYVKFTVVQPGQSVTIVWAEPVASDGGLPATQTSAVVAGGLTTGCALGR